MRCPNILAFAAALLLSACATESYAAENFAACPQFFANAKSPVLKLQTMDRALCYDAFAILHSGESKTAVFVAQKLNRAPVADADEKRKDRFFCRCSTAFGRAGGTERLQKQGLGALASQ